MKKKTNMKIWLVILIVSTCPFNIFAQIYNPLDYTSLGTLAVDSDTVSINTQSGTTVPEITVDAQTYYGVYATQSAVINSETFQANVAIFCFDNISIDAGVTINVSGSRALYLLSKQDIILNSNLDMQSVGASNYGMGLNPPGGSGFFGTGGGHGGWGQCHYSSNVGVLLAGGRSYGEPTLSSVLLGGSRGGWGAINPSFGYGGGAVALIAAQDLSIGATISVEGKAPPVIENKNGCGSAGSVLIKAPNVTFETNGFINALGGANGASLHGASGRVAVYCNTLTGYDQGDIDVHSIFPSVAGYYGWGTIYMETPEISLSSPNGGEKLIAGKTHQVEWISDLSRGISQVLLEYSTDNGQNWTEIAVTDNTGYYDWLIPNINSESCLLKISDYGGLYVSDSSDAVFTIFECSLTSANDINNDCYINLLDIASLASEWLECGNPFDSNCQ